MEGNETLQTKSAIGWCTEREAHTILLCQGASSGECDANQRLPPRASASSRYQYDYSNYNFDVVTIEVHNKAISVQCE